MFRGRMTLAGDKSVSHRAALLAALAQGESRLRNFASAADCASTLRCLAALGVPVRSDGDVVVIEGAGLAALRPPAAPLDAGNSGSTLRMLAGVLAACPFRSVLTGDASLRRRPMERVAAPLREMGARVETTGGCAPLTVDGGPLEGIEWPTAVPSAQVKTAVLLAGMAASGRTTVRETLPTRDHTERLMPAFGVPVTRDAASVTVAGGSRPQPAELTVPGDASSAAFLVLAALIVPGSEIRIEGVLLNPLRTAYLDALRAMGGDIEWHVERDDPEPAGWIEARSSRLTGVAVPPERLPRLVDEVPVLAVAGAFAEGRTTISGAAELRVKESDRLAALASGLRRMGGAVEERPDGLVVDGGRPLAGAAVETFGDHRIAMALWVAGLAASGETRLDDAGCVAVSFPEFPAIVARATGDA
jgi:3-phosphoshikimate 1-carboxyvinyltransferase